MTARVQRLDPETAGQIAAGEVIERPDSVVKELIDNALDAGSSRVEITLQNGGRRLIQVADNGCGMTADEAVLALQRFTTSKIRQLDDLTRLTTLGFRGEALPSIVAMAEVEVVTRPDDQIEGAVVRTQAEGEPLVWPIGCPVGTRIRVHRLFAQTPVRLNALKSISREVQRVHELVAHYALAHPKVIFRFYHDERRLLVAAASTNVVQRLSVLFNRDVAAQMLPVNWQSVDLTVYGAISAPLVHRSSRQRQYLWVNGRPIRSGLISAAVARAYGARLPPGRHPLIALGLTLPSQFIDVNVHPQKREITFIHERAVYAAAQEAVELALQRIDVDDIPRSEDGCQVWSTWSGTESIAAEPDRLYDRQLSGGSGQVWQPMGQVGNTFIVAGGADGLILLDQHATHESLIYSDLLTIGDNGHELSNPLTLSLPDKQRRWVSELKPILVKMGIELEPFGNDTLLIRTLPLVLVDRVQASHFVEAIEDARQRLWLQSSPEDSRDQLAAALSCRAAIRAGDALGKDNIKNLVDAIGSQRVSYTCPHGRPTYTLMSVADLERRFLRLFPLDT